MFYSELLNVPHIENRCAKCEKTFEKWSSYHAHVVGTLCIQPRQYMPVGTTRNLVGVKQPLSDKRKAEIVQAWELKNKENIIQ